MRNLLIAIGLIIVFGIVSCSRSAQHQQILLDAETIAVAYPDSAIQMLEVIVPSDLKEDTLKALYAIIVATAHKAGLQPACADISPTRSSGLQNHCD